MCSSILLYCAFTISNLQPFWCTGQHSNQSSCLARGNQLAILERYFKTKKMLSYTHIFIIFGALLSLCKSKFPIWYLLFFLLDGFLLKCIVMEWSILSGFFFLNNCKNVYFTGYRIICCQLFLLMDVAP